jgi:hypothetical protein
MSQHSTTESFSAISVSLPKTPVGWFVFLGALGVSVVSLKDLTATTPKLTKNQDGTVRFNAGYYLLRNALTLRP